MHHALLSPAIAQIAQPAKGNGEDKPTKEYAGRRGEEDRREKEDRKWDNRQKPREEEHCRAVSPAQAEARSRSGDKDEIQIGPLPRARHFQMQCSNWFPRPTFLDAAPASDVAHLTALPRLQSLPAVRPMQCVPASGVVTPRPSPPPSNWAHLRDCPLLRSAKKLHVGQHSRIDGGDNHLCAREYPSHCANHRHIDIVASPNQRPPPSQSARSFTSTSTPTRPPAWRSAFPSRTDELTLRVCAGELSLFLRRPTTQRNDWNYGEP